MIWKILLALVVSIIMFWNMRLLIKNQELKQKVIELEFVATCGEKKILEMLHKSGIKICVSEKGEDE